VLVSKGLSSTGVEMKSLNGGKIPVTMGDRERKVVVVEENQAG